MGGNDRSTRTYENKLLNDEIPGLAINGSAQAVKEEVDKANGIIQRSKNIEKGDEETGGEKIHENGKKPSESNFPIFYGWKDPSGMNYEFEEDISDEQSAIAAAQNIAGENKKNITLVSYNLGKRGQWQNVKSIGNFSPLSGKAEDRGNALPGMGIAGNSDAEKPGLDAEGDVNSKKVEVDKKKDQYYIRFRDEEDIPIQESIKDVCDFLQEFEQNEKYKIGELFYLDEEREIFVDRGKILFHLAFNKTLLGLNKEDKSKNPFRFLHFESGTAPVFIGKASDKKVLNLAAEKINDVKESAFLYNFIYSKKLYEKVGKIIWDGKAAIPDDSVRAKLKTKKKNPSKSGGQYRVYVPGLKPQTVAQIGDAVNIYYEGIRNEGLEGKIVHMSGGVEKDVVQIGRIVFQVIKNLQENSENARSNLPWWYVRFDHKQETDTRRAFIVLTKQDSKDAIKASQALIDDANEAGILHQFSMLMKGSKRKIPLKPVVKEQSENDEEETSDSVIETAPPDSPSSTDAELDFSDLEKMLESDKIPVASGEDDGADELDLQFDVDEPKDENPEAGKNLPALQVLVEMSDEDFQASLLRIYVQRLAFGLPAAQDPDNWFTGVPPNDGQVGYLVVEMSPDSCKSLGMLSFDDFNAVYEISMAADEDVVYKYFPLKPGHVAKIFQGQRKKKFKNTKRIFS